MVYMRACLYCTSGLGKKTLSFDDDATADEVHLIILDAFSKLSDAGGYEILRVMDKTKTLDVITAPPEGYTVAFLKDIAQQAKLYIRPIRNNLSMDAIPSAVVVCCSLLIVNFHFNTNCSVQRGPKEKCRNCHQLIIQSELRNHMEKCVMLVITV